MAKIEIVVAGTHGEVRPLLALGVALREAGHEVVMCAPPNEEKWITSYGFKFYSAGCDIHSLMDKLNAYMGHPVKMLKVVKETLQTIIADQFRLMEEPSRDVDMIIGGGEPFAAPSFAQKQQVPFVFVNLVTQFLPSSNYPPTTIPWQNMPKPLNKLGWKAVNTLINLSLVRKINENRQKMGLSGIKDVYAYMFDNIDRCLIAINDILDPAPEYSFPCTQTGLWHVPEVNETGLEPELIEFLESGPPPVYIGFGSMSDHNSQQTIGIIEDTIHQLGVRAIISKGWADFRKNTDSEQIYMAGFLPHTKLFPKVAAVVHHGGPGTVYTAAWAGVPQVIVPHMLDHYYQGDLLYKKKLAPKAINRSKLNSTNLSEAIRTAITDPVLIENNAKLGEQLRQADQLPIQKAVASIEQILAKYSDEQRCS